jgi:dihydrodipicolinate synthase/N-acetylneuraminate lyase
MIQLFAPLVTPFAHDESLDRKAILENLERYSKTPLDGYLVNGTSGEAEMLTERERLAMVRLVVENTDRPVVAGLAPTSIRAGLKEMESLGTLPLKALLIRTPSYYGSQLDQVEFYHTLAQESPHPVMVYQIPQCTGLKLAGDQLQAIAEHPNIVGVKDSLGDLALLNEVRWPQRFQYFLGASALIQPGLAAGAHGGILALANVVPELCRELLDLSADPMRTSEARALQQKLIPLNRLLGGSRGFGVAGLKAACEMRGYNGGLPRRPLRKLSEAQREELDRVLQRALT